MDKKREDEIVGSLYGTEHFGSSRPSGGGISGGSGSGNYGLMIKIVVILLAVIAFAAYSKAEDKRREKEYREMWKELYKGYSDEDWERSRCNRDGTLKTNYTSPSQSSVTTKKSSDSTKDTTKKNTTYKNSTEQDSDSFNVKDYRDPEDFYDDHYDDFFDYEDAEDYYYEHGGC